MSENGSNPNLRLWPGVVIVVLQWIVTFGAGLVAPATFLHGITMTVGPALGLVALLIWWFFRSRAPRGDRWLGLVLPLPLLVVSGLLLHPSAYTVLYVYGVPFLCLVFVVCVALTRKLPARQRRLALAASLVLAAGIWILVRSDGVDGDMAPQLAGRWQPTVEEELLAAGAIGQTPSAAPASRAPSGRSAPEGPSLGEADPDLGDPAADFAAAEDGSSETVVEEEPAAWPGFRGIGRDAVVPGARIATDWQTEPPRELWRTPVGPGWGSFAIAGDLLYTQEQHGEEEVVSAYRKDTGETVWLHRDTTRFWEAMAGPGPRATPTFHQGRIFALGATGILNALDAVTGDPLWSRNVADDTGAAVPDWGFSSSPLVIDRPGPENLIVVVTGAPDGKGVVAYEAATGEPRWYAPTGPMTYSSAHVAELEGARQILVLSNEGAVSLAPADGSVLWQHAWPLAGGARVVQPAFTPDGDVLLGTGFGVGVRRIAVARQDGDWTTEERWTAKGLKPYYNDMVVHREHLYGFDGRILACLSLEDGERAWKGGRYGNGQLLLLPEQDLLLVLSDRGDIALVRASPAGFEELARQEAISGKTWNHPVLADGVLYVRNGQEMAAFRMPG